NQENINRASGAAIGFLIASVIFAVLVVIVKFSTNVPDIDASREAAISQALFEIHTNEAVSLNNAGWIDKSRGIVRLPIEDAMKIAAQQWQNPAQARADLLSREQNATKPAPVAPAKPNPFE
ncbi:MAG TPA: hypothetical protein VMB22_06575, partial [Verrucomicrobiae bacterium]|nr:hypothetical protein [Verrucomicrobiae bacterium]